MTKDSSATATRSLSAWTWLARNPRRVLPIALVLALVTALEISVITPLNAFESTAEATIRPLQDLTIVTPLRRSEFDADLVGSLEANPHMDSRVPAKTLWIDTPAILGDLLSPLVALRPADQEPFLERLGLRLVRGTLPQPGTPGAAIHAAILRARDMDLGDVFGRMVNPKDSTSGRFEVVGVLEGEPRLGILDLGYTSVPTFVLARRPAFQVIYAKTGEKAQSDAFLRAAKDEEGKQILRVLDERRAREVAEESLENLPLIVGFITAVAAIIVAFVVMLISVISFQARTDEFALYLAVGHRRARLVRKLTLEATITAFAGWVVGVGIGLSIVALYAHFLLEPKAILVRVFDPQPLLYTLMVPVLAAVGSAIALGWNLRRMDPVAVIQRRGA